jgi:hypothetical protein
MVEASAFQQIKGLGFRYASLKLNAWHRIQKDVNKRSLTMLRAKVVYSMKEGV